MSEEPPKSDSLGLDLVKQLQNQGLSKEEAIVVARHRRGATEQLESGFSKVNRNPWNIVAQALTLGFFCLGSWLLWALLHLPKMMENSVKPELQPAFTKFLVMLCLDHSCLMIPPALAGVYCAYVWSKKSLRDCPWTGFFAVTVATLILFGSTIAIGLQLPVVSFMNQPKP